MTPLELLTQIGATIGGIVIAWNMFQQYFPYELRGFIHGYFKKLIGVVYPYLHVSFPEYTGERLKRSELYANIQSYLGDSSSMTAKRLKANVVDKSESLVLSMDDHEEITDNYKGIKVWWATSKQNPRTPMFSWYPEADEKRYFKLTVHRRYRDMIKPYVDHVMKEGKAIAVKNRQRKLYTNNPSQNWYGWKATKWSHVAFEHPASFDTLAMATKMKEKIRNDLIKFSKSKEYYAKIGKPWKRGYLLYGPPGTGKSTMIAAMANFLDYDVYDLELTTVKDNSELRKLLIDTTGKSIIVIEDIDCSLDLTGQRKTKNDDDDKEESEEKDPVSKQKKKDEAESKKDSKVTLSGLLNFIDGIWSACGGERIIVFTTNFMEKLDPALIRRGRMDMRIEMPYCCFEAFKFLAKNYLDIEYHEVLYPRISKLLEETNMTPADVAENLMPKSDEEDAETCLKNLVAALEDAKEEEAKKKAEEEANKLKAEQEAKEKKKEKEEKKLKEEATKEDEKENENSTKEIKANGSVSNGKKESSP